MAVATARGDAPLDARALAGRIADAARVVVDVGAGDGRYALAWARDEPGALVIGVDPAADNLREVAARAARRRGGAPNLVLLRAAVEALPPVLRARADEVHVILPWGRLLEGLVVPDPAVVGGLGALAKPGGRLRVLLNAGAWGSAPARLVGVPRPDPDLARRVIAPALAQAGFTATEVRMLGEDEARAVPSTWARRLAHRGRTPEFLLVEARRD